MISKIVQNVFVDIYSSTKSIIIVACHPLNRLLPRAGPCFSGKPSTDLSLKKRSSHYRALFSPHETSDLRYCGAGKPVIEAGAVLW
jgi:hypothetical protein